MDRLYDDMNRRSLYLDEYSSVGDDQKLETLVTTQQLTTKKKGSI